MTNFKNLLIASAVIAFTLFMIPVFAMIGLALLGITFIVGLIGAVVLRFNANKAPQSRFARNFKKNSEFGFG